MLPLEYSEFYLNVKQWEYVHYYLLLYCKHDKGIF